MSSTTTSSAVNSDRRRSVESLRTTEVSVENATEVRAYALLLAACVASACLPIWLVKYPSLIDYPNSLARSYILYHSQEPPFREHYTVSLKPLPYLAMDAVVVPLQALFDIEVAGKVFLTTIVLLFAAGCHLLGCQIHGRPTWLAPCCSLFATNSLFLWGWVNYAAGIGLYLIAFAAWMSGRRGWTPARWAAVAVLALVCYLAHLSSFVFLGVSVAVVSAFDWRATGRLSRTMLIGLAPLSLPPLVYLFVRQGEGVGVVGWGSVVNKLVKVPCLVATYSSTIFFISGVLVLVALAILAARGRSLGTRWPTFAVGVVFGILFLAHPDYMLGAAGVDVRYVPVAAILMLLSLSREVPRRAAGLALAAFLGAMALRQADIWHTWAGLSRRTEAQLGLAERIPEGSRVLPVIVLPGGLGGDRYDRPFMHTALYLDIYRRCFVPTLFANRGLSVLEFKTDPAYPQGKSLPALSDRERWRRILGEADYIWAYKLDRSHGDFFATRTRRVDERGEVTLLQVLEDR